MKKVPVLVTGGAGYIGSHAMLALKDAGWSVSVIDNLSNGVREAVPEGVPFYEGNIADAELVYPPLQLLGTKRLFTQLATIGSELRGIEVQQIGESRHVFSSCRPCLRRQIVKASGISVD